MASIVEIGDDNFDAEVLNSNLPVLIDFWAPWCGPCRVVAPLIEELAREYDGRLKVAKLNVDDHPLTPSRYGVRGIPNLILFHGGTVRQQIVGAVAKEKLVSAVEQVLRSSRPG
jgi:thioredoxin 1